MKPSLNSPVTFRYNENNNNNNKTASKLRLRVDIRWFRNERDDNPAKGLGIFVHVL